jgi:hypothetical protein
MTDDDVITGLERLIYILGAPVFARIDNGTAIK